MGTKRTDLINTRETILEVATQMFGEDGFVATSLSDVAKNANVTKGAVYHYFGSKERLFRAVHAEVERAMIEGAHAATELNGGPIDHIKAGVAAFLDGATNLHTQRILFVDAPVFLDGEERPAISRGAAHLTEVLDIACRENWIRPIDTAATAVLISGACQAAARVIAESSEPATVRQDIEQALGVLIDGLDPDRTAASNHARELR